MTLEELFSRLDAALAGAEAKGWGFEWDRDIVINMTIIDQTDGHRSQYGARGNVKTFEEAALAIEAELASLSDRTAARKEKLSLQLSETVAEAKQILTKEEFDTIVEAVAIDVIEVPVGPVIEGI